MGDNIVVLPDAPHNAALGRFRFASTPRGKPGKLARCLRGAVASHFGREPDFHGHAAGHDLYRHPPVHYRWTDQGAELFAMGQAVARLMSHPWPGTSLNLDGQDHRVEEVSWQVFPLELAHSPRLRRYRFGAPWLALNQENFSRFKVLSGLKRRAELDRILVGNLLSLFKGLGRSLPAGMTVYAAAEASRQVSCMHKGVSVAGFEGGFVTNFQLPRGVALGRAVSHGHGWLIADS